MNYVTYEVLLLIRILNKKKLYKFSNKLHSECKIDWPTDYRIQFNIL